MIVSVFLRTIPFANKIASLLYSGRMPTQAKDIENFLRFTLSTRHPCSNLAADEAE